MNPTLAAAILALGLAPVAALAQTATTESTTEEASTETAEPEPPEYNGSAYGSASGRPFNMEVVCEGFDADGPVTVKSDPGGAPGEDVNGDGNMLDVSATPDGSISLQLLTGNNLFGMDDSTAQITAGVLTYKITMTFSGGVTL